MKEAPEDLIYQIALLEMMHVGPRVARKIIKCFGSAEAVIKASDSELKEIGDIGLKLIHQRGNEEYFSFAKAQLEFCNNKGASVLSYFSKAYPSRLKQCIDAPQVLYQMGHCNLNSKRMVAIVGTRNCTKYGRDVCAELVEQLEKYDVTIVSGLAYGIDACAHRNAIKNNMYNIGVVAHGLDRIYPSDHKDLANSIVQKGAILTEFPIKTNPDRENFPQRNRIVAGMVDAIVVIESAAKGGSLITARLGNDYNRDVFAVPGTLMSEHSKGCNYLIKSNQAQLFESVADIALSLGWKKPDKELVSVQQELVFDLNEDERKIAVFLGKETKTMDEISVEMKIQISELSTMLLLMELNGVIKQLPGKKYQIA